MTKTLAYSSFVLRISFVILISTFDIAWGIS